MLVSRFNSITNTKNSIQTNLLDELNDIKEGKYKSIIEKCRFFTKNNDYDSYKSLKISLPIVTFCGTFKGGRKLDNLKIYNSIMILDIDHIGSNINEIKNKLITDKYIYSVWLSPSNEGVKALVKIDSNPEEHKLSFNSLKEYFKTKYNIELDKSGSDVTRLCFVSWDKDLYLNINSEVYVDKLLVELDNKIKSKKISLNKSLNKSAYATEGLNKAEHRKTISLIIKYLKRKQISITNTYEEWFRVALAISSTFSYDLGEKYFLSICELDKEKHNELESINILKYCYNNRLLNSDSSISLGTVVFYAKEKGFITKKDKYSS
ncbi:BT4734/BF3469 family protein [Wenyingzhuangia sp. chi5]|uniref:BT4734/BF3469 family protein n=1 Tax=Wenyingzhuangia gilva TaxID=3057677 RepID=A0ABT8VUU6_9FLAO|nr:BT4734/BF3469 family protein [Wenyingzhuangia sp. chi5]MDO3695695.1 BT4734/BF3469 family protein [Wenyingzhuangia sp. chi5]